MSRFVGTSGYSYKTWVGDFYPSGLKPEGMLQHYASQLPAVELNNTFYRVPKPEVVSGWAESVPHDFRFSVKATRRITHFAKLKDCEQPLEHLSKALLPMANRLGAVLFQLPPQLTVNAPTLERFLHSANAVFSQTFCNVPGFDFRAAVEFRHASWLRDDVFEILDQAKAALVLGTASGPKWRVTGPDVYVRARDDHYDDDALRMLSARLGELVFENAFVFFKHEQLGPAYAKQLLAAQADSEQADNPAPEDEPREGDDEHPSGEGQGAAQSNAEAATEGQDG